MRAHACVCAGEVIRGGMRTRAQVRCNRGAWVRVRASILAHMRMRSAEPAHVGACACVQVRSGANVAQSNRGECRTISDYLTCVRARVCVGEVGY